MFYLEIALRNSPHADLVESAREEGGKGGAEGDRAPAASDSDPNADHVLLADEALDVPDLVHLQRKNISKTTTFIFYSSKKVKRRQKKRISDPDVTRDKEK